MNNNDLEKLISRLPAVPGVLGKHEYFNPAILIPLVKMSDGFHFLFEVRAENIPQGGEVCFPGGRFNASSDSSLEDTALRETSEELGLSADRIKILGCTDTYISAHLVAVNGFIGILDIVSIDELRPDPMEVQRVFTIPVEYFRNHPAETYHAELCASPYSNEGELLFPAAELGLPERYCQPWGTRNYKIYVYRTDPVIWGITARFIEEIVSMLKA
jgi:8-oxo-dGTP pyrophosphatase MutT (NUDIX family)